jgi:hypothetical protein
MYVLGGGGSRLQPVTIKAPALRFMQQRSRNSNAPNTTAVDHML